MYILPSLPAFFEEHDIRLDKGIMMIISGKEYLHILADKISYCFPNLPDTPLHLPEAHSQSKLKMFLRQCKRSSLNLLTEMQQEVILFNTSYRLLDQVSAAICSFFFYFQQHYFHDTELSTAFVIKSKYRCRLVQNDLLCALAETALTISELLRKTHVNFGTDTGFWNILPQTIEI